VVACFYPLWGTPPEDIEASSTQIEKLLLFFLFPPFLFSLPALPCDNSTECCCFTFPFSPIGQFFSEVMVFDSIPKQAPSFPPTLFLVSQKCSLCSVFTSFPSVSRVLKIRPAAPPRNSLDLCFLFPVPFLFLLCLNYGRVGALANLSGPTFFFFHWAHSSALETEEFFSNPLPYLPFLGGDSRNPPRPLVS